MSSTILQLDPNRNTRRWLQLLLAVLVLIAMFAVSGCNSNDDHDDNNNSLSATEITGANSGICYYS